MKEILIAKLILDTFQRNKIAPLVVPKGDYGARVIQARIKDYGKPISVGIDDAVSIVAKRSGGGDSLAFSGRANQDGTVTVPVTQWMLDIPDDDVVCHIVVTGNDYQYSTTSFLIQPQEKENPNEISEDDPRVDVVTEVLANENARMSAENERVSNEEERKSNEEERKRFYEETKPLFSGVENFLTNNNIVQTTGNSTTSVMSQEAVTAEVKSLDGYIDTLNEVLNVEKPVSKEVTTKSANTRYTVFSGIDFEAGKSYRLIMEPISATGAFYLYVVEEDGTETGFYTLTDGRIDQIFSPSVDMPNASIKVSSAKADTQIYRCTWYEVLGENRVNELSAKTSNLFDGTSVVEFDYSDSYFISGQTAYAGQMLPDVESCATSYIPVIPGSKIKLGKLFLLGNRSVCVYDKERNFVSFIVKNSYATDYTFVVPQDCYYVRLTGAINVKPTIEYLSIPNYLDSFAIKELPVEITNGYYITKYGGLEGREAADESSAISNYIPVIPNSVISIVGAKIGGNYCTAAYDKDKKFVTILVSSDSAESKYTKNIVIPSNARYIRITSNANVVPVVKMTTIVFNDDFIQRKYIVGKELFDNAASKPVLSFVDDDTWNAESITRLKNLCDANGIKMSWACLTSRINDDTDFINLLLQYEREGFPVIIHGYTQGEFYKVLDPTADIPLCENDFVRAIQDLKRHGFADFKIWCTPFGGAHEALRSLCNKWGVEGLIMCDFRTIFENPTSTSAIGRFCIKRYAFESAEHVDTIKSIIDNASVCNGWVLLATHSAHAAYYNGDNDVAFAEVINYARSKGFEIRTVNEELRRRMPIYNYYEQY